MEIPPQMKQLLRKLFSPILSLLEKGQQPYAYKRSHRTILLVLSGLFTALASFVFYLAQGQDLGYLFPVVVFGGIGLIGFIVALLGSDRAVATLWGSK